MICLTRYTYFIFKKLNFLFFVFLVTSNFPCLAYSQLGFGYWVGIFPRYKINEVQNISLQTEYREIQENRFILLRPSLHARLSKHIELGLGYDYFAQDIVEQRLWPELALHTRISSLSLVDIRLRHEYRFRKGISKNGERSRVMIGINFDLSDTDGYSIYFFDEIFFAHHDFSRSGNSYDRNWLGLRVRKNMVKYHLDYTFFWESINESSTDILYGVLSIGWDA